MLPADANPKVAGLLVDARAKHYWDGDRELGREVARILAGGSARRRGTSSSCTDRARPGATVPTPPGPPSSPTAVRSSGLSARTSGSAELGERTVRWSGAVPRADQRARVLARARPARPASTLRRRRRSRHADAGCRFVGRTRAALSRRPPGGRRPAAKPRRAHPLALGSRLRGRRVACTGRRARADSPVAGRAGRDRLERRGARPARRSRSGFCRPRRERQGRAAFPTGRQGGAGGHRLPGWAGGRGRRRDGPGPARR